MTSLKRIVIGALGAFTPILLNLLVADFNVLPTLTRYDWLGYIVRAVVLLFIGGMVGYLNKSERNMLKLFQMGIAAPALITASIGAKSASRTAANAHAAASRAPALMPIGYAQIGKPPTRATTDLASESAFDQFWRGLTRSGIQLGPIDFQVEQYKLILSRLQQKEFASELPPTTDAATLNEVIAAYRQERSQAYDNMQRALRNALDLDGQLGDEDGKLRTLLENVNALRQKLDQAESAHDQELGSLAMALKAASDNQNQYWSIASDLSGFLQSIAKERRYPEFQKLFPMLQKMDELKKTIAGSNANVIRTTDALIQNHKNLGPGRESLDKSIREAADAQGRDADRIRRLAEFVRLADDSRIALMDIERRMNEDVKARLRR